MTFFLLIPGFYQEHHKNFLQVPILNFTVSMACKVSTLSDDFSDVHKAFINENTRWTLDDSQTVFEWYFTIF